MAPTSVGPAEREPYEQPDQAELTRLALDTLADLLYVFSPVGQPLQWNARVREVTGYSDEEIAELSASDFFIAAEDVDMRAVFRTLRAGGSSTLEVDLVRKDGRTVPYEVKTTPLFDASGQLIGICGTGRDISGRHAEARRLKARQERIRHQSDTLVALARGFTDTWGDLDATVQRIAEAGSDTLGAERASVWRLNEDAGSVRCIARCGAATSFFDAGKVLPAADYPASFQLLDQVRIVAVDDAAADARLSELSNYVQGSNVSAFMAAPIRRGAELLGMIVFERLHDEGPWHADEQQFAGSLADLVAFAMETAGRAQVEAALRESRRRYRAVVESVQEVIFQTDPEGRWTFLNPAWTKITGTPVAGAIDRSCTAFVHPEDQETAQGQFEALVGREQSYCRIEVRFRRHDGEVRWVEVHARPFFGENGEVEGVRGTLFDVTERRAAEQAMRAAESKFRSLVEQSLVGIYIIQDGRTRYVNPYICDLLGYSREEIMQDFSVLDLVVPEDRTMVEENMRRRLSGETETLRYQLRMRRKDGTVRDVEVHGSRTEYEGRPAIVGSLLDVTARTQYERGLIQAKEHAEEMSLLKTTFLANMSHEIRTPLTSIIGFADILADEVDETNREFVRMIRASGRRLMETLNSVLDLAQLEGGALELEPQPFNVAELVEEIADLFMTQAQAGGLTLCTEAQGTEHWAVMDRSVLQRVLANLVSNAIKFTPAGRVDVRLKTEPAHVVLEVADTGIGIDPAFLPRLYDEFTQESSGVSRDYEGNGLGLTITRRLVALMQGEISVQSEKGEGTTFRLRFPRFAYESA